MASRFAADLQPRLPRPRPALIFSRIHSPNITESAEVHSGVSGVTGRGSWALGVAGNFTGGSAPSQMQNQLGMYVSSNSGMSGDAGFAGGGYSLRNSGVSITDTAGLIAPGTNSPSYHENGGVGGLSGTYDASRFVGPNQHLFFNGAFDYTNSSTNFGGVAREARSTAKTIASREPRSI